MSLMPIIYWLYDRAVGGRNRQERRAAQRMLVAWENGGISLDEAFVGVFGFGQTGSGKTSCLILAALLAGIELNIGIYIPCIKPDDRARLEKLVRAFTDKVIVTAPDTDAVYDAAEFIIRGAPDPAQAFVNLIMSLGEVLSRNKPQGGQDSRIWEQYAAELLFHAATVVLAADGRITINRVHQFILGAADSVERVSSDEFQETEHCKLLARAEANAKGTPNWHDVNKAQAYWVEFWPSWNNNTRSSAASTALVVLSLLTRGLANQKLCAESPTFSPELLEQGYVWIDAFPPLQFRELGAMIETVNRLAVQAMVSRRMVTPSTRPILILLDECAQLICTSDALYASTSRSQKGINIYACQSVDYLYAALGGREDARTNVDALLGSFAYCIGFANAGNTNEFLATRIGKRLQYLYSFSARRDYQRGVNPFNPPPSTTTASCSQHFEFLCPPTTWTSLLRGGPPTFAAEAIVHSTAGPLDNGQTFQKVLMKQVLS